MKKQWFTKMVVIGVALMLTSISAHANPGMGRGWMGGTPGSDLTDEQISQMESERQAFLESSRELHQQLRERVTSLRLEQNKQYPDTAKIESLQNEITELRSELEQKWEAHISAMQTIDPDFTAGRGMGGGMMGHRGHGPGHGMYD